jgi:hypothetical protein
MNQRPRLFSPQEDVVINPKRQRSWSWCRIQIRRHSMTDRSSDAQHRLDPTCSEPIVIPLHSSFLYLRERPKGAKLRLSSSRSILLLARWNKGGEVAVDPAALRICILRGSKANEAALVLDHAVFSFLCNLDTDAFHVAFFAHRR